MVSVVHTMVVELLESHPEALSYLLSLEGPAPAEPLVPTTGTRSKAFTLERRVDRAYLLGSRDSPRGFVLTEVQLGVDPEKFFAWALYVELARSRYRCEGALVVLTFHPTVRAWIEREIAIPTGLHGSLRQLRPRVLAVDHVAPELLLRSDMPYLAPLAVAGHLTSADAKGVAEKAVDLTVEHLPIHLAQEQLDGILAMVDAALRAHLENRVMEQREYHSDLFRKLVDKGKAEGLAEGKAEGLAEGKAEGLAEGKAEAVLQVLALRKIPVSAAARKRVMACSDLDRLDHWLSLAMVASSAAAVLSAESAPEIPAARSNGNPPNGHARTQSGRKVRAAKSNTLSRPSRPRSPRKSGE